MLPEITSCEIALEKTSRSYHCVEFVGIQGRGGLDASNSKKSFLGLWSS